MDLPAGNNQPATCPYQVRTGRQYTSGGWPEVVDLDFHGRAATAHSPGYPKADGGIGQSQHYAAVHHSCAVLVTVVERQLQRHAAIVAPE